MKVVIDGVNPIGDDMKLEVSKSLSERKVRISILYDDDSGPEIEVAKYELLAALTAFTEKQL